MLSQAEVALSANPRAQFDLFLLMSLASVCVEGELYEPAIKLAEDAVAASSRMGGGLTGLTEYLYDILGQSYLGAKRYEEAVDAYKKMANLARYDQMTRKSGEGYASSLRRGKPP